MPGGTTHPTSPGRLRPRRWVAASLWALGALLVLAPAALGQERGDRVLATTVDGAITPVIADHVGEGIARAEREGYRAYLMRLDTPGGLDTSMRDIVQDILASEVPVIVYISPQGARGASAGAIITFAAHVAAMAPGTAIGAATPVGGQGGEDLDQKVINDAIAYAESLAELRDRDEELITDTVREGLSVSAAEALDAGAIDVVAGSEQEVLEAVDGDAVVMGDGEEEELVTADAAIDEHDLGVLRTIQQWLADPNIAFLFLSIGTLGLIYELASPGLGVGGALGLTFILLALFGLAVLPVDIVGVLFLLLAAALFVAEVFAPGIGLAAAGGILSLVLSGVFLIDDAPGLELSLAVALPTAIVVGLFVILAGRMALRTRRAPSTTTGRGAFVGATATVRVARGEPQVFLQGAWWAVRPRDPSLAPDDGAQVEVVDMEGLHLVVEPSPAASAHDPDQEGVP